MHDVQTILSVCAFLLTIIFGLVAYIGQRLANSLENIDKHVRELTVKIAIHDERFKNLEAKLDDHN